MRIVVINHLTLDGVMQAPGRPDEDTRGGFSHGGWAVPGNDEVMGHALALVAVFQAPQVQGRLGQRAQPVDAAGQVVEELAGHLRVVPEAKSRASLRTLSVPPFLMDTLAGHLARFRPGLEADSEELVFLGPRGGVLRRRFGDRILAPAAERAGLNGLTFHALRHAAVTALVDEGVHPRVMQARAGHDTARLTMERYAHVTDGADREAAAALEARFAPAMAGASGTRVARRVPGST